LRIGFIEPHLRRYGGIRRMVELANHLVPRGHEVIFYLPDRERLACEWMPCRGAIRPLSEGFDERLDVVCFNEETQWFVPQLFRKADKRIFYALHYARLYGKSGSWESIRADVDYQLANSRWTADRIEEETGHRPEVLLGGVNRSHFRPVDVATRYPILCVGDNRWWKGTDVIRAAGELLGLPVETYAQKNLPQERMAQEYCRAEVFVVGSDFDGFAWPGLEALACGVPLVTTDNGGCREYAVEGVTALVVPPRDPQAMAAAIDRLRNDRRLADKLRRNGLELVDQRFGWDQAASRFEAILEGVVDGALERPGGLQPNLRARVTDPVLSVVVLAWDQLHHTQRCVESLRQHTDVPYELIIVDNGSEAMPAAYAAQAADVPVLNEDNLGFSVGMNQGMAAARGRYIAFVNNDTAFPPGWASRLIATFEAHPRAGLVVPAVTAAGNKRTVRAAASDSIEVLRPFEAPPSAVVYLMERSAAAALQGWGVEYLVASAEDVDLCFKIWVNGLDIVFDQRVLVEHVAKGTAGPKLDDYEAVWARNRAVLLAKWTSAAPEVPDIGTVSEGEFARNLAIARSVAGWMQQYFRARDRMPTNRLLRPLLRVLRPLAVHAARFAERNQDRPWVRRIVSAARERPAVERLGRRLK
jgi:glycosyltransferase involved in cell wall biosynthesis/GT2 family glycosyltransferase